MTARKTATAGPRAEAFLVWVRRRAPEGAEQVDANLPAPGPFVPAGDRWAGWWQDDLTPWPEDADLGPERIAAALRRLTPDLREVLVMAEATGTPAPRDSDDSEAVALLERARQAFVHYMGEQVTGGPASRGGAG